MFHEPLDFDFWKALSHSQKGIKAKSPGEVEFHGEFFMNQSTLESQADFSYVVFCSRAEFIGTRFNSQVNFRGANFDSTSVFYGTEFSSKVDFSHTKFHALTTFTGAQFGTMASFRYATFRDAVYFESAVLPDTLDVRNLQNISREVDLTSAKLPLSGRRCKIALMGSDIKKFRLRMDLFQLWFPDRLTFDQNRSVYETVLKKLQEDGLLDSYEMLDIEYRDSLSQHDNFFNKYIGGPVQKAWSNYGHNKTRIFAWSLLFFSFFSVVNLPLYRKLYEVYPIDFIGSFSADELRQRKKQVLHVFQTMTYTGIIFFGFKLDLEKFGPNRFWQHPWLFSYIMFTYVLGLVCLGFIVNIILAR
jgi:hypothetical protein